MVNETLLAAGMTTVVFSPGTPVMLSPFWSRHVHFALFEKSATVGVPLFHVAFAT